MPKPVPRQARTMGAAKAVTPTTAKKGNGPPTSIQMRQAAAARPKPKPQPQPEVVYPEDESTLEQPQAEAPQVSYAEGAEATAGPVDDDLIPTPKAKIPPPTPDAHDCTINGATMTKFDSGSTAISVLMTSDHDGQDYKFNVFVPDLLVDNYAQVIADPEGTLPNVPGTKLPDGSWSDDRDMQLDQYLRNVKDGAGNGVINKLLELAKAQGQTAASAGVDAPEDFEGFVNAVSAIIQGCRAVFTRRPGRGEGNERFLNINAVYPPETGKPGSKIQLKGYRKLWAE